MKNKMKKLFGFLFLIIAFAQQNASAQTFYLNKEIFFYEDDDSLNAETTTRQVFDTLGRLVFEENVGWSKTWFSYEDTFLVSKIEVRLSDSMDTLAEKTFHHFYNDTSIYNYKYTLNKKGQLIYRSDSIRNLSAKKPASCTRYKNQTFDYTRVWRGFTDSKTMEYDSLGRKISEKSKIEKSSWKYDSFGRVIEELEGGATNLFRYTQTSKEKLEISNYGEKVDTIKTNFSFDKKFDKQGRIIVIKETVSRKSLDGESKFVITTTFEYKKNELIEKRTTKIFDGNVKGTRTYITISKNKRTIAPIK